MLLVFYYHMDKLYYIHDGWLYMFPLLTGILGTAIILVSGLGIFSGIAKHRIGLVVFSVGLGIIIFPELFTIYAAGKVTADIDTEMPLQQFKMQTHLEQAIQDHDESKLTAFFKIQEDFGCCGIDGRDGYIFWKSQFMDLDTHFPSDENGDELIEPRETQGRILILENSLPESCCIKCGQVCECNTETFFTEKSVSDQSFYKVGCLPIIEMIYKRELLGMFDLGYILFALGCTALEFGTIFLAAFFIKILAK